MTRQKSIKRRWSDFRQYPPNTFVQPLAVGQTGCRYLFFQFSCPVHRNATYRARHHNLMLASKQLQNILIKPGQIFSFNRILGSSLIRRGYMRGSFFLRDRWVSAPEAGLEQMASAIYYLALLAGLEVIEHHQAITAPKATGHEFIPTGFEACIFQPYFDMRFRNAYPFDLALQTQVASDQLTVTFYAKDPQGFQAQLEPEIVKTLPPGTENRSRKDPSFALGTAPKTGSPGCVIKCWRKVYQNQEVIEKKVVFERVLSPVHEVIWVP